MEFSGETMTRKEYLKSKKKVRYDFRKVKYALLIITIVLLGIYVFKQLKLYNRVTVAANKVIEESALAKTLKIYYVALPYTKDGNKSVMMYNSFDESRTKIQGTDNMINLTVDSNMLYGIIDKKLYRIDLITDESTILSNKEISNYIVIENNVYVYLIDKEDNSKTGIYNLNNETKDLKQIISGNICQMVGDKKHIYIVGSGKTNRSILRYDLNGNSRTQLTDKEIVERIIESNNNIYFTNRNENGTIYSIKKDGKGLKKIISGTCNPTDVSKNDFNGNRIMNVVENTLIYINSSNNDILYAFNLENKSNVALVNKKVESLSVSEGYIYYKPSGSLDIYKYDIYKGKSEKTTSIRGSEYITKD